MIQAPDEFSAVLTELDGRADVFKIREVEGELNRAVDKDKVRDDRQRGWWAERAAFSFYTHLTPKGGPWQTYFQPEMTFQAKDGSPIYCPDLSEADPDVIDYWKCRANTVKHPVLQSRYADLVWDTAKFITGSKPDVNFARLAIDAYVATAERDDGKPRGDVRKNLGRGLNLALSIGDDDRISKVVEATIDYVERTAEDDKIGTYCYLFDNLLPKKKGPTLSDQVEQKVVTMLEAKFAQMTRPDSVWDANPHAPQAIGLRLASYYQRKGRNADRRAVMEGIARVFERRAKIGDATTGLFFLDEARKFYLEAGRRDEAERIQRQSQELAPKAKEEMPRHTFEYEIPNEERDEFLKLLVEQGFDKGLELLVFNLIPEQTDLEEELEMLAKEYPLQALFSPTLLGEVGIQANVAAPGDPDGRMAFETASRAKLNSIWLAWGLDHLWENGLTPEHVVDFVAQSPVFTNDRLPLILRAVQAHFVGDYIQAIHMLIPQLERAVVSLTSLVGGTSTKPHRSGRAVMQSKSLNDALDDDDVRRILGPDLRMYLVSTLSHPKGMNIRNDVSHGLWSPQRFSKQASERVLHVLLALGCLRERKSRGERPPNYASKDGKDLGE